MPKDGIFFFVVKKKNLFINIMAMAISLYDFDSHFTSLVCLLSRNETSLMNLLIKVDVV